MSNILALDQSLSESGYSVFDSQTGILVTYGVIKTKPNKNLTNRISLIVDAINILIADYDIDVLILEAPITRFVKVTRLLTSLYAILSWEFRNLNVVTIPNVTVKKFCCLKSAKIKKGNGKSNVADYCNKVLGTKEKNNNITDSFGLYLTWKK